MCNKAFVIVGDHATAIANDVIDFRYCATLEVLEPDAQLAPRSDAVHETQVMLETGTVQFMIGGATVVVLSGDFVRVPVGVVHSCRNLGDTPARLMIRRTNPLPLQRALRVAGTWAA